MRFSRSIATAVATAALAGSAAVCVPASAATPSTVAINAGGKALTASGTSYSADQYAAGGNTSTLSTVTGTSDTALYKDVRYGMSGYSIPVTNGTYDVTLKMVENYWTAVGKRVFDVSAEGTQVVSDLDLFQAAGGKNKAVDRTFTTTVKDGKLDLGFTADRDKASIAAVLATPKATATPAPSAPAPTPVVTQNPRPTTGTPLPTATPSTGTTSGTSTADRASWKAPTLQNPLVWVPSASQRYFKAPADRDVLIKWPSTALDVQGGFELTGGRNVVSTGGTVKFSKRYFPSMVDQPNNNRCLKINGNDTLGAPRTVHVEGFHCAGSHIWEGINVDSKAERATLTVQFRDIRVDGVHVEYPGGTGKHIGGDALQVWNGPHRLLIDGFTAKNLEYQGFFLQPYQFGTGKLGTWDIRNVNLEGAASRSAYILWLAGTRNASDSNGVQITVKNVYVQPGGGRTRASSLWEADKDWYDVTIGKPARDFVS
ncbi:malectin domain-containing carbohydrate-binding protein [Kineococcus arenarius]|uniref:malectin domain-containing carbohydrate-binding protein n=1 Tax=unclassified Kineococcus TaxID=2621656 RepID=UPI003D7DAB62